ncbi:MAG: 30S ribosomal protein S13 [Candidatus Micrarchaeota archaeon]
MATIEKKSFEKKPPEKPKQGPPQHMGSVKHKNAGKEGKDFKGIVRILGKDVEGHVYLRDALRKVKGIGQNLGLILNRIIKREMQIYPAETLVGNLSDAQMEKVEEIIKAPQKHGVRPHSLNRPRDVETSQPAHFLASDLAFTQRQDLEREKGVRSWRGWRISMGQRVRGQHSRTTGRTGMSVGVLKKAIKAQKAAAATSAQEKGAPKEEKKK